MFLPSEGMRWIGSVVHRQFERRIRTTAGTKKGYERIESLIYSLKKNIWILFVVQLPPIWVTIILLKNLRSVRP